MDDRDRQAIDDLFGRLAEAGGRAPPRDAAAEALIRDHIRRAPETAYYLAQTAIMQEQALARAEARLQALEEQAPPAGRGGFLAGLFGGGRSAGFAPAAAPRSALWGAGAPAAGGLGGGGLGGGGFLAGAAQTAMGVTGGILLGHALGDLFDGVGERREGFLGGGGEGSSEELFGGGPDLGGEAPDGGFGADWGGDDRGGGW